MALVRHGKKLNIENREPTVSRSEKSKPAACEISLVIQFVGGQLWLPINFT